MTNDFEIFDRLQELGAYQFKNYVSASQYSRAYKLMRNLKNGKAQVLDWGAGQGHFSYFLLHEGFSVTSYSIEPEILVAEHLSKKFPAKFNCLLNQPPAAQLPFDNNHFDIVTSIGVLEHVRETGGEESDALDDILRVIKPGGFFFCYHFPNRYSWIESVASMMKNKATHRFKFTRAEILDLISAKNCRLIKYQRYGFLPRLMLRGLPNIKVLVQSINLADQFLSRLFPWICQNHLFILQKLES